MFKLTSKLTMFKLTDFFNLEKGLVFSQGKKRPLYLVNTNNDKSGRCLFFWSSFEGAESRIPFCLRKEESCFKELNTVHCHQRTKITHGLCS